MSHAATWRESTPDNENRERKGPAGEPVRCVSGAVRRLEQISIRDSQEVWFSADFV